MFKGVKAGNDVKKIVKYIKSSTKKQKFYLKNQVQSCLKLFFIFLFFMLI